MDESIVAKKEILALVESGIRSCELLVENCDSWLPEEEGIKNMRKRYREHRIAERKKAIRSFTYYILRTQYKYWFTRKKVSGFKFV